MNLGLPIQRENNSIRDPGDENYLLAGQSGLNNLAARRDDIEALRHKRLGRRAWGDKLEING